MKLSKRTSFYLIGVFLLALVIILKIKEANLIWITILVLSSTSALILGLRQDMVLAKRAKQSNSKGKIISVTLGAAVVVFGLGYTVGKLIYLWAY